MSSGAPDRPSRGTSRDRVLGVSLVWGAVTLALMLWPVLSIGESWAVGLVPWVLLLFAFVVMFAMVATRLLTRRRAPSLPVLALIALPIWAVSLVVVVAAPFLVLWVIRLTE